MDFFQKKIQKPQMSILTKKTFFGFIGVNDKAEKRIFDAVKCFWTLKKLFSVLKKLFWVWKMVLGHFSKNITRMRNT